MNMMCDINRTCQMRLNGPDAQHHANLLNHIATNRVQVELTPVPASIEHTPFYIQP